MRLTECESAESGCGGLQFAAGSLSWTDAMPAELTSLVILAATPNCSSLQHGFQVHLCVHMSRPCYNKLTCCGTGLLCLTSQHHLIAGLCQGETAEADTAPPSGHLGS